MNKMKNFFSKKSGPKTIFNVKKIFIVFAAVLLVGGIVAVVTDWEDDTSAYTRSRRDAPSIPNKQQDASEARDEMDHIFAPNPKKIKLAPMRKKIKRPPFKYGAKQVIVRKGLIAVPTGAVAEGVLSNLLDTREKGAFVRVVLPRGVNFGGRTGLPSRTLLLGVFGYEGRGKKVVLTFTRAILPDGREMPVRARAAPEGVYRSNRAGKTAMLLGLTMASGMADVMAQKRALGEYGNVTVKSSLKNAIYHGASKATEMEASRQEQETGELSPYVTLDKGSVVTVVFTAPLKAEHEP